MKLLFRSRLQLLYTRLEFCIFLVKLSTGFVYCCAVGFRAGYFICCVVLFWSCINSSIKYIFFGDYQYNILYVGPVLYFVSSWRICLRLGNKYASCQRNTQPDLNSIIENFTNFF